MLRNIAAFRSQSWQPATAIDPQYAFLNGRHMDAPTLAGAATIARTWNVPLHQMLLSANWISDPDYAQAVAIALGCRVALWDIDFSMSDRAPWPPQVQGLAAFSAGEFVHVLSATQNDPTTLAAQIASLRAAGLPVVVASNACLEAGLERAGRNARLARSIFGLHRAQPEMSARWSTVRWQGWVVGLSILVLLAGLFVAPMATLQAMMAAMSLAFFAVALTRGLALAELFRRPVDQPEIEQRALDSELPTYSILVPLFHEISVLPDLVEAMASLDYPVGLLEILLVIEDVDIEMQAALIAMELPGHFRIVVVPDHPPRTKPKALNYALETARGEFLVVYDAEDRPDSDQLRKAVASFRDGPTSLACVQARLNIYNARSSWISRQFTIEYCALFDAILPSLQRYRLPIPLGGTSNHFPRQLLLDLGGWDPFNVTEDADLGIRLARRGLCTRILDATTWEEAPVHLAQWFRQRTRWLKGWMQTWLVHMRNPLRLLSDLGLRQFLGLQVVIGGILLSAILHPIFYGLALAAIAGYPLRLPDTLVGQSLEWIAWGNLALGYIAAAAVGALAAARRRHPIARSILLLPLYWLLISAAVYRALWQLWRDPHYWEKTPHGLVKAKHIRRDHRQGGSFALRAGPHILSTIFAAATLPSCRSRNARAPSLNGRSSIQSIAPKCPACNAASVCRNSTMV